MKNGLEQLLGDILSLGVKGSLLAAGLVIGLAGCEKKDESDYFSDCSTKECCDTSASACVDGCSNNDECAISCAENYKFCLETVAGNYSGGGSSGGNGSGSNNSGGGSGNSGGNGSGCNECVVGNHQCKQEGSWGYYQPYLCLQRNGCATLIKTGGTYPQDGCYEVIDAHCPDLCSIGSTKCKPFGSLQWVLQECKGEQGCTKWNNQQFYGSEEKCEEARGD